MAVAVSVGPVDVAAAAGRGYEQPPTIRMPYKKLSVFHVAEDACLLHVTATRFMGACLLHVAGNITEYGHVPENAIETEQRLKSVNGTLM